MTNHFDNALDEGDIDGHMSVRADDIRFESPFGDYASLSGYRERVGGFHKQARDMGGTRHLIVSNVVTLDGERATQTCSQIIVGRTMNDGAPGVMATARMEDELVRTAEGWRFARRVLHPDQDPSTFGG